MIVSFMIRPSILGLLGRSYLRGQQAGPQATYPAGQANADVAVTSAANIIASMERVLIVTMSLSRHAAAMEIIIWSDAS
jgi:hypothetical protein